MPLLGNKLFYLGILIFNLFYISYAENLQVMNLTNKNDSNFKMLNNNFANSKLLKKIEDYAKKHNIQFGIPEGDRFFTYGISTFDISKDYERRKVFAFEKAYLDALKKMAQTIYTRVESKIIQEIKESAPSFEDLQPSNSEILKKKILALTDASLNKALEKLGVSPEKIGNLNLEKKRNLLLDSYRKKVISETLANLGGTLVLKTFEEIGKDGNCAVGVIVYNSGKLKNLADYFARGDIPPYRNLSKAKPIEKYLPKTPKEWLATWGVQVVWDNKGYPALISYAQWGYPLVGSPRRLRIKDKLARKKADLLARSYIAQFLNMNILSKEIAYFEQKLQTDRIIGSGMIREIDIDKIAETLYEEAKATSKANIKGLTTLKVERYCYKIKDYQACSYFVVKILSPQNMIKVDNYLRARENPRREMENVKQKNNFYKEEHLEGISNTDVSDW
ncbi:MAG TPA: hypothetical protein EYP03_05255 [Aquificae bacterium]|nr:hypothetical protein [Aquificota bacterium]